MKFFRLKSLGCRANQYEIQAIRDQLISLGYVEAGEGERADLVVLNSCTVTEGADRTSRQQLRALVKENPGAEIVVTGCLADKAPEKLHQISGVTKVVSNAEKENLVASLFQEKNVAPFSIRDFKGHTRAFVKVQDGCNSFCSYCIIPFVRGRSRSRSIDEVVCEVRQLVSNGFQEVVITGINVGDFGGSLASLLRAVDEVKGLKRLRLSSIHPHDIDSELVETILRGKATCRGLHISLQSGANTVLKRMYRKYTQELFLEKVENLRRADPDFTFTTDLIVGFPGESEADFEETLEVVRAVQFAKVHIFPYSPREKTKAASFPDHVASEVVKERKKRLFAVAEEQAFAWRERFLRREMVVLTEKGQKGHTDHFVDVTVLGDKVAPNQLVEVKIVENCSDGLIGKVI